jgi:feruloyl esterase
MTMATALLLSACGTTRPDLPAVALPPPGCDDGLKTAFKPDALTTVVSVRSVKKGEKLIAVDYPAPITTAVDLCLLTSSPP